MRKVMLLKATGYGGSRVIEDDCEATFIKWGTDAIEYTDGFAEQTIAVCEKADGTVVTPLPMMIRFIDKGDGETCKWKADGTSFCQSTIIRSPHGKDWITTDKQSREPFCPYCGKKIEVYK